MIMNILLASLVAFTISAPATVFDMDTHTFQTPVYLASPVDLPVEDVSNETEEPTATEEPIATEEPTATEEPIATEEPTATEEPIATEEPTIIIAQEDNSEEVALLATAVELLAENSTSVTGTVNSTVLTLMDRMIDAYPSYYRYAGFRTSDDDSYASTLYIAKNMSVNGNTITFSDDCVAVTFARQTTSSGYSGYIYFTVSDAPSASVEVSTDSIVYTNCLAGYPSLGTRVDFKEEYIWIGFAVMLVAVVMIRRGSHD